MIARLAADRTSLGRLPAPWQRTALWLMFVLPYVATVTAVHLAGRDVIERVDVRMAVEQGAILLTGLTAALAAFSTPVPGVTGEFPCFR